MSKRKGTRSEHRSFAIFAVAVYRCTRRGKLWADVKEL